MSNGSTGASDVLVGNYHMRHDWNYLMDKDSFVLQSPPDGGSNLVVPIDWALARKLAMAHAAMMVGSERLAVTFRDGSAVTSRDGNLSRC